MRPESLITVIRDHRTLVGQAEFRMLLDIPHVEKLPAVQWRLRNLAKADAKKRELLLGNLRKALKVGSGLGVLGQNAEAVGSGERARTAHAGRPFFFCAGVQMNAGLVVSGPPAAKTILYETWFTPRA